MALSVRSAWRDRDSDLLPSPQVAIAVMALWGVGLLAGMVGWLVLLGVDSRRIRGGFLAAQLGKYVPGAVVQIIGQVGFAVDAGVSLRVATATMSVFAVTQVGAGFALTPLAALLPDVATLGRLAALAALPGLAVLDRRWMIAGLRRIRRLDASGALTLVPAQGTILRAWLANCASVACAAFSYGILLHNVADADLLTATVAFAAAWTVGFVVFPIPAGLGLREVVLLGLLSSTADGDVVVAASVFHRLLAIAAEGGLAGVGMLMRRQTDPTPDAADRAE
jgi:uncharacterized membrane protein YbhN (UPF0104 family)